jgi:hypothetical protein
MSTEDYVIHLVNALIVTLMPEHASELSLQYADWYLRAAQSRG